MTRTITPHRAAGTAWQKAQNNRVRIGRLNQEPCSVSREPIDYSLLGTNA